METPGFKRRDLPRTFSVELRRAVERKDFRRVKALLPRSREDLQAKPVRMDGNTVQLDEELLAMNRNALNYEYPCSSANSTLLAVARFGSRQNQRLGSGTKDHGGPHCRENFAQGMARPAVGGSCAARDMRSLLLEAGGD